MDTQTAITTLQAMLTTIESNITGLQGQRDAIQLAISQLQGTLSTQLTELEDTKAQLAAAHETIQTLQTAPASVTDNASSVQ